MCACVWLSVCVCVCDNLWRCWLTCIAWRERIHVGCLDCVSLVCNYMWWPSFPQPSCMSVQVCFACFLFCVLLIVCLFVAAVEFCILAKVIGARVWSSCVLAFVVCQCMHVFLILRVCDVLAMECLVSSLFEAFNMRCVLVRCLFEVCCVFVVMCVVPNCVAVSCSWCC